MTFNTLSDSFDITFYPDREPTRAELLAIESEQDVGLVALKAPKVDMLCDSAAHTANDIEYELVGRNPMGHSARTAELLEAYQVGLLNWAQYAKAGEVTGQMELGGPFPWEYFETSTSPDNRLWSDFVTRAFSKAGYRTLGSGHFATALSPRDQPDLVVKLGYKKEDSGAAYAAFCRNVWSNYAAGIPGYDYETVRHFPRVAHLERTPAFYTVTMPRYDSLREYNPEAEKLSGGAWRYYKHSSAYDVLEFVSQLFKEATPRTICEDTVTRFVEDYKEDGSVTTSQVSDLKSVMSDYQSLLTGPSFVRACLMARAFFTGVASFDIHDENIMVMLDQGKYVAVLTDPVSFSSN